MSLHFPRPFESRGLSDRNAVSDNSISHTSRPIRTPTDAPTITVGKRSSIASGTSSVRRSSGSVDSLSKIATARPSALPRFTSGSSQARLSHIASNRPPLSYAGKSPTIQASMPDFEPVQVSTGLSTSVQRSAYLASESQTLSPIDMDEDTVLGVVLPRRKGPSLTEPLPPQLIPELQALAASTTQSAHPASSSISSISSPSTQFTSSTSPWSASTTATTPVSWSSASPSIAHTAHSSAVSKRSNTVPLPSHTRSHLPRLPILKESRTVSRDLSNTNLSAKGNIGVGKNIKAENNASSGSTVSAPPSRSISAKSARSRSMSRTTSRTERTIDTTNEVPRIPTHHQAADLTALPSLNLSSQIPQAVSDEASKDGHSRLQVAINSSLNEPLPISRQSTVAKVDIQPNLPRATSRQLLDSAQIVRSSKTSTVRQHRREASVSESDSVQQSARSRLAKFSRLAIFGRSKHTEEVEPNIERQKLRKGPTAGTGHEGYGRFGRRTRKPSMSGNITGNDTDIPTAMVSVKHEPRRRSGLSSGKNSQEQSDLDEFAASRSKPVVLKGGSMRGRAHPFPLTPIGPQHSGTSLLTVSSAEDSAASAPVLSTTRHEYDIKDTTDLSSSAAMLAQKPSNVIDHVHTTTSRTTRIMATPPPLDSKTTTASSISLTPSNDMHKLDPALLDRQRKKSSKSRWNIFRRKGSLSEPVDKPTLRMPVRPEVSVNIIASSAPRSMPHYAMLDSEVGSSSALTLGQFLREAAHSPPVSKAGSLSEDDTSVQEAEIKIYRESILLPSAPVRNVPQQQLPPRDVGTPFEDRSDDKDIATTQDLTPRRVPRLAQVGRIPKVVPSNQRDDAPLAVRNGPLSAPTQVLARTVKTRASREQLPRLNTKSHSLSRKKAMTIVKETPVNTNMHNDLLGGPLPMNAEFLRFSDVRSSDFTTSSSSTGMLSMMGPTLGPTNTISQPPIHSDSHDDDVWREYDDFLDDVMSPSSARTKQSSRPKQKTQRDISTSGKVAEKEKKSRLAVPQPLNPASRQYLAPPLTVEPPSLSEQVSQEDIRLRRSRIAAALHASYTSTDPSSPFSMNGFISDYNRPESGRYSHRTSASSTKRTSLPVPAKTETRVETLLPRHYNPAAQLEEIERTRNPLRHSDQAYASLMVSRWLSFGRVLFSEAHTTIQNTPERKVLVIDGLGSEDWSIYCAVTYQAEKAYIHDLKERRSSPHAGPRVSENSPANHRRAEVASFDDKFPFPPDFFQAIVLRFPPAMADSKLKNIISECRRVLCPGGYLEMMVLDMDIVNMGVQTRRAIKDLKIKMSAIDRDVSLKPIIDNVSTVLASKGFSSLSRCMVGVPVVGKASDSSDSSSESRSSAGSFQASRGLPSRSKAQSLMADQVNFSLNDLVADHSENADAKIGRVVSRTARSWWQHCFEASITTSSTDNRTKSVFSNKTVLEECKTRASSFKMLIAYTQKPMADLSSKRRTMSEPTVPTLATVGIAR